MKASLLTKPGAKRRRRQHKRDTLDPKNYLLSTMHAIVEHDRVEEELRRSEAYLALAQRLSHTGSWALNVSTGELFWSQEHFRIVGLDPGTAKPGYPTSLQVTHPEDRSFVQEKLETAIRERTDFEVDCRIVRPDGTIRHIHSLANPVFNQSGELIEYVGTIIDVTERKQAEALLRQANARSEMILDSITDRFLGLDSEWRFTYFNKHAEELLTSLGKNPTSLIGKVLWEEFPVRHAEEAVRRAMSQRVVVVHEFYFPPLKQWIEGRIYPTPDGGVAVYERDISERKRAEEELRRSEAYLAEGQKLTHTGSWAVNLSSGDVFWSQEMFRIYGVEPAKTNLSQSMAFQLIHPKDRAFIKEAFQRAVRDKTDYDVNHRAILSDGTLKYIHSVGHPVLNEAGDLTEYIGMAVDVTERTQAEALLREANARVEMILDSITDHFFAFDKNWRFTYLNKHSTEQMKILGKDPVRLIGKILWEEFPEVPNEKALRRVMSERVAITDQFYYAPLGEWVENHMYPSQDGGLVTFQKYITSRKRTEEKLHQTQAELAHVTRASTMGELAASIAHEINQPLGAIVNNSNVCLQLVGTTGSDERKREALLDIVNDANRASAIIARIRALTKGSAPETIPLGLKDVVADVLVLAQRELLENRISVKTELAKDLPLVPGDRVQFQQVLLNLVMNAIDAMSAVAANRRVLTVRAKRDELEGEPVVLISVQDSGIGLRPEDMHRLFQPFHSTKPHGMGMGLRIARSIVEGFGGRLWAKRDTGPGATFCCALPIEKVSLGGAAEPNAKVD